jgi:hypothetical protein
MNQAITNLHRERWSRGRSLMDIPYWCAEFVLTQVEHQTPILGAARGINH